MSRALNLLQELVSIPAPPGQEAELTDFVRAKVKALGLVSEIDAKGNLLVRVGPDQGEPKVVVTAHLDELALMVTDIDEDGVLGVTNLGGARPWKWGEGPMEIFGDESWPGVLSFGSVHTTSPASTSVQADTGPLDWSHATVITGRTADALTANGVRPGTRVAISRSKRQLTKIGELISGYFLDDRADLAAWLLALEKLAKEKPATPMVFAATVSEEVGGEGALYMLHKLHPDVCVALELGPVVPDSTAELTETPTVWCKDGYAAMSSVDHHLIRSLGVDVQFQVLSGGGSDASCAASHGLCARPVTFGIPMENTHGYEIIHRDGIDRLAELTLAYLAAVGG